MQPYVQISFPSLDFGAYSLPRDPHLSLIRDAKTDRAARCKECRRTLAVGAELCCLLGPPSFLVENDKGIQTPQASETCLSPAYPLLFNKGNSQGFI